MADELFDLGKCKGKHTLSWPRGSGDEEETGRRVGEPEMRLGSPMWHFASVSFQGFGGS